MFPDGNIKLCCMSAPEGQILNLSRDPRPLPAYPHKIYTSMSHVFLVCISEVTGTRMMDIEQENFFLPPAVIGKAESQAASSKADLMFLAHLQGSMILCASDSITDSCGEYSSYFNMMVHMCPSAHRDPE